MVGSTTLWDVYLSLILHDSSDCYHVVIQYFSIYNYSLTPQAVLLIQTANA